MSQKNNAEELFKELVHKTTSLVLNSRIIWPLKAPKRKTSQWFNLDIEEHEDVTKQIDKALKQRKTDSSHIYLDIFVDNIRKKKSDTSVKTCVLLERWHLSFDNKALSPPTDSQLSAGYKKAIVMIRSLYSYSLLMPTYKLFRRNQIVRQQATMQYYISNMEPTSDQSSFEEGSTTQFTFGPVSFNHTTNIKISVQYRKNINFDEFKEKAPIVLNIDHDYFAKQEPAVTGASLSETTVTTTTKDTNSNVPQSHATLPERPRSNSEADKPPLYTPHSKAVDIPSSKPRSMPRAVSSFKQQQQPLNQPRQQSFDETPPFSNFGSLGQISDAQVLSTSPAQPPFPTEYMNRLGTSWKNKNFKFSFSPLNDSPLNSYHPRSNSIGQHTSESQNDTSDKSTMERPENVPSVFMPQQGALPLQRKNSTTSVATGINMNSDSDNTIDVVPAFLRLNNDSSMDMKGHDSYLASDMELEGSGLAFAMTSDSDDSGMLSFLQQLENPPPLKAFGDVEMSKSGLSKSVSHLYSELTTLHKAKNEMFGLKIK